MPNLLATWTTLKTKIQQKNSQLTSTQLELKKEKGWWDKWIDSKEKIEELKIGSDFFYSQGPYGMEWSIHRIKGSPVFNAIPKNFILELSKYYQNQKN